MPRPIDLYDAGNPNDIARATAAIGTALTAITPRPVENLVEDPPADYTSTIVIQPNTNLLGIDQSVYELINQTLVTKRHLLFYGPPGTGKTTLAEYLADELNAGEYILLTGTADWTSQDMIGGYQPAGQGEIKFVPGLILENFDRPIIIDELNRVDIDKAIGPLFTVLSGQQTTLPYQLDPASSDPARKKRIHILPAEPEEQLEPHQFAPTRNWRLFATINTLDKASLYQFSYALSRRFGWILIDVPADLNGFIVAYLQANQLMAAVPENNDSPLAKIWTAINAIRPLGPAPIIDIIKFCLNANNEFDFFATNLVETAQNLYLNGFYTFILPLLDGILQVEAEALNSEILAAVGLNAQSPLAVQNLKRIIYHAI